MFSAILYIGKHLWKDLIPQVKEKKSKHLNMLSEKYEITSWTIIHRK